MEGCAIFILAAIAITALAIAVGTRNKLKEAQADIDTLRQQAASLWQAIRELRMETPAVPRAERETWTEGEAQGVPPHPGPSLDARDDRGVLGLLNAA